MGVLARRVLSRIVILLPLAAGAWAQTCNTVGSTTTCTAPNGQVGINTSTGALNTYPLQLTFSGLTGTISNIQLTVNALTTNFFNAGGGDFRILLVSPTGEKLEVLSQYCNDSQDITGKNLTFADGAAGSVGGATLNGSTSCANVVSGTFKPTAANEFQTGIDTLPTPAPSLTSGTVAQPQGTGTFAANFTGNPNGTWLLYVAVASTGENASIGGASTPAWSLAITTAAGTSTTTTLSLGTGTNPSFVGDSLTVHAVVSPTPTGGTVAFKDNGATISGCGTVALSGGAANCTTSGLTQGAHDITAVYSGTSGFGGSTSNTLFQGVNHVTTTSGITATSGQYCNTGGASVTVSGASQTNGIPFNPYPSPIFVGTGTPSLSGIINTVTIDINSYQSNEPDLDALMLVGPNGKAYEFMSFVNGGTAIGPLTIHFSDSGSSGQLSHTAPPTNGNTYQPTAFPDANPDNFCTVSDTTANVCDGVLVQSGAPNTYDRAPGRGTATLATEFGGISPNGTWQLFPITLDGNGHSASIGSWCLNFSDSTGDATTTVLASSANPSATGANVTFTATITDNPHPATVVNGGTVAFSADGNLISGCSAIAVSSGTAQCTTSALLEGAHTIQATYSGTASFGTSSGSLTQRVNTATTGPTVTNQTTYTYCDPGAVNAPAGEPGNAIRGIAQPWPSEINVTNLPGTLNKATLTLKNFVFTRPDELESLVVPPTGVGLDFLSVLNTITPVGNPGAGTGGINFNIADGGSSPAGGVSANGTFAPYSGNNTHTYTVATIGPGQTGPPGGFAFAAPGGSGTLAAMIGGGGVASTYNGNGIWSLYMEGTLNGAFGGALSGWCVNLTINPPVLTISKTHSPSKFLRGSTGTITVTVGNNGPGSTGGTITVTDTLPTGFTFKQMDTANGWSCSGTTTVSCTNAAVISQGGNSQFSFDVNVGTTAATSSVNNISAAGGGDITTRNNSDTIPVIGTDLSISKTHTGDFTAGQTGATYTIKLHNNGPADTDPGETISVTDSLPADLTATAISGTNWTCTTPPTLMCTTTTQILNGADSSAITLTVNVATNPTHTQVTNSATLSAPDDINSANNTANDVTNIISNPDLTVAKTHSPASFTVGDASDQIPITVSNIGPGASSGTITVTDTLPTGLTFVNSTTAGWSCSSGNPNAQTVKCTSTSVINAVNGTSQVVLNVSVANSTSTPLTNNVAVACSCTETNTNNNTATDSIPVIQAVTITLDTSPTGLQISGDGGTTFFTAPHQFQWIPNSQHTIATTSPQAGTPGTQFVWTSWSDAGAISHTITTPSTPTTFTANFKTQFLLTTAVNPAGGGTITPPSGFVDSGSQVQVTATANSPAFVFLNFSGALTGTTNPQTLTVTAPATVTANFNGGATSLGANLGVKSGPLNARVWPVTIGNNGPGEALGAQVSNLVLAQTGGSACTPVISGLPALAGDLAPHATATASITIDFSSCAATAVFKATFTLSANGGAATATVVKLNQVP